MNVIRRLVIILSLAIFIFFAKKSSAWASEGPFILRNIVGEATRCEGGSILMQDRNYHIFISCRDISYPGGTDVFSYVVWAVPTSGGNHFRLGTLGLGKVTFTTKTAFSNLYVTKEGDGNARNPSGPVIMQGRVGRYESLDGPPPTPGPEIAPSPTPIPTPQPRNLGRILAAGGVLAFIAIFGIILVIFVITKK